MTRITPGGPAEVADLRMGDKIMQVREEHFLLCQSLEPQDGTMSTQEIEQGGQKVPFTNGTTGMN